MIKALIKLQDLRRRLYVKAKAEPTWRFWGLYVHVCKRETLWEAYQLAKQNNGAPGVDGVTFQAIEAEGLEQFLERLREELVQRRLPRTKKRTALLRKLKLIFRSYQSQPTGEMIEQINPILRGWVNYFAVGHSSRCFSYIRNWVETKVRRHLAEACQRRGFGWKRWSKEWLYGTLGLFNEYRVVYQSPSWAAAPIRSTS